MENAEFYETSYYNGEFTPEKRVSDAKNGDYFIVDELLNHPNDENMVAADGGGGLEVAADGGGTSPDSSITPVDTSCNSTSFSAKPHFHAADIGGSRGFADGHFSGELCVPYDAELEWLSNFVEESFSSDDLQKLQLIQGMKARNHHETSEAHQAQYHFQPETTRPSPLLPSEMSVPAKARSKRSRAPPLTWTSRLLVVSPTPPSLAVPAISSSSESDVTTGKKSLKQAINKKKEVPETATGGGDGRRCQHCATDKTPQWRTGPMGPKTLCNACGVRYKSGRLVPEYRPASSPTFVLTKHSNSHRKVLELRRQKEMMRAQQHQQQQHFMHHHHQGMMFDVSNGDDYLIHQHIGPDFMQLNI